MTAEQINSGLIEILKEKIPAGTNLAHVLMDLLCIGKEAVYRRLRGEVPFTLEEATILSGKLGISLDKLIHANVSDNVMFDLNFIKSEDPVETYCHMLDEYTKLFVSMCEDRDSEIGTASNMVPQMFTMDYEFLSKFRFAKWMYQNQNIEISKQFEEIMLPDKMYKKQKQFVHESHNFKKTIYVWDSTIFASLINDIKYFVSIGLISDADIRRLKDELLSLIEDLYIIASKGKFHAGNDVQIYISNINFEATYSYLESQDYRLSMLRVFSINSMTSKDEAVFVNLKEWIHSLKKFSMLISQSGEMQRIQFFNRQRELVRNM